MLTFARHGAQWCTIGMTLGEHEQLLRHFERSVCAEAAYTLLHGTMYSL